MTDDANKPDPPAAAKPDTPAPTQRMRWLKYGSNVAVFVVAVVAIVVIVNWLVAVQLGRSTDAIRFDLTQTRAYSLSPQTRRLLGSLGTDVHVVVIYAGSSAERSMLSTVGDLLGEYASRSGHIDVRSIDAATDPVALDALTTQLLARFEGEAAASRAAFEQVPAVLAELKAFAREQDNMLGDLVPHLAKGDADTIGAVSELTRNLLVLAPQFDQIAIALERGLSQPLPDLAQLRGAVGSQLSSVLLGQIEPAIVIFKRASANPQTPDTGKDMLLGLIPRYEKVRDRIRQVLAKLTTVHPGGYDELRSKIGRSSCVVMYTDVPAGEAAKTSGARGAGVNTASEGVVALAFTDIYAPRGAETDDGRKVAALEYEGEERVTGALLRLTLDHHTKVVFVNGGKDVLLRARAPYGFSTVADRLRQMRFDVEEWQPGATKTGPDGKPVPAPARPTAAPGQKLILVYVPSLRAQPGGFDPAGDTAALAVAEHVAQGRPALVFTLESAPNPAATGPDLIAHSLEPFGITVHNQTPIFLAVPLQGGVIGAVERFAVDDWAADHPIAAAVRGLTGYIWRAQPISLSAAAPEGVKLWPLGRTDADSFTESNTAPGSAIKRDKDDPAGPFVFAAAAEKSDQRLVVIADRMFATDYIAADYARNNRGEPLYISFPANGELFANSIYWLAGLDQMVAPGARSQDIRRVAAISDGAVTSLRWMLIGGLPALSLIAGTIVWAVRRR